MIMGGLTIVYPQGLPEFDPVRQALENNEDLEGTAVFLINRHLKKFMI
jgi:hypothetical protein